MTKKMFLLVTILFVTTIGYAQKPKKTHDYKVFAEKFTKFTRGSIVGLLATPKAQAFISSKTGQSVEELNKAKDAGYKKIKEEIFKTKEKGLLMMYEKAELVGAQETPIKKADIKIFVNSGNDKYTLTLKNCIQTNTTWVLGDGASVAGPMFGVEEAVTNDVSSTNNSKSGPYQANLKNNKELIGKPIVGYYVTNSGNKIEATILNDNPNNMHNNDVALSIHESNNSVENLPKNNLRAFNVAGNLYVKAGSSWFVLLDEGPISRLGMISSSTVTKMPADVEKVELIGKPVRGYYIDYSGKKTEAVIKYQEVSRLQNMKSTFLLYNVAYNEKGFTEDEGKNFKSVLMKNTVKEFHIAGNTYFKTNNTALKPGGEWKVRVDSKSYSKTNYVCKTGEMPKEVTTLTFGFKKSVSKMTTDYTALSNKIKNKEKGYKFTNLEKIRKEYNTWYETQYPGKFKYILANTKTVKATESTGSTGNSPHEKFGKALLEALKSDTPDKLLALSWTSQQFGNTVNEKTKNEEMKNGFISRFKKKDPNNEAMQKATIAQFKTLKEKKLDWERAEYVDFKFKKQGISKEVNFDWGSAILKFEADEAHYKLKVGEYIHMLDGWKGGGYMLM